MRDARYIPVRRPRPLEAALVAFSACALASLSGLKLAIINESPSLPLGLYLRDLAASPSRGAVVALPPPPSAQPYLQQIGMPQGVLLLKRVAAGPGDLICAGPEHVRLPGRILVVRPADSAGRALPAWSGCTRLAADEVFLAGDTPASFDSRYFGPVRTNALAGVFRLALAW